MEVRKLHQRWAEKKNLGELIRKSKYENSKESMRTHIINEFFSSLILKGVKFSDS